MHYTWVCRPPIHHHAKSSSLDSKPHAVWTSAPKEIVIISGENIKPTIRYYLSVHPGEDGSPLSPALPGQFVVLRMRPNPDAPPLLRNYSLSDVPSADHYRVSVKHEVNGEASTYLHTRVRRSDVLDVSAPMGSFTLRPGEGPVVLVSAGVGATPVLAMLHALVAGSSARQVWWLYGARSRDDHPFFQEARDLLRRLQQSHSYVRYSRPGSGPAWRRLRCSGPP